ncbi:hypothetical protein M422DRAFT_261487 [Sphaerobolus stellatus SS14]|uniref:Unplaced genomic scaffold SPHSTscaffold_106, whole genome shotgun sequence n=1 Tax=Sphaerobolus stellatus (strain SS14) TaxID=990650 RepID=A0A0C9UMT0_SPHS4|nr:hypothetical protein M422DRAFT_261487 [Sphaerobolus stellatus SS14]
MHRKIRRIGRFSSGDTKGWRILRRDRRELKITSERQESEIKHLERQTTEDAGIRYNALIDLTPLLPLKTLASPLPPIRSANLTLRNGRAGGLWASPSAFTIEAFIKLRGATPTAIASSSNEILAPPSLRPRSFQPQHHRLLSTTCIQQQGFFHPLILERIEPLPDLHSQAHMSFQRVIRLRSPSTSADPVDLLEAAMGGMLERDPARANSYHPSQASLSSLPLNVQDAGDFETHKQVKQALDKRDSALSTLKQALLKIKELEARNHKAKEIVKEWDLEELILNKGIHTFTVPVKTMKKPELQALAFAMNLSREGTKGRLTASILALFEEKPELKLDACFQGIFAMRCQRGKVAWTIT